MPLRSQHIRWTVFAVVVIGVLTPIVLLSVHAFQLGGGAYGKAVTAELASRLRCEAVVRGARPTGPGAAAADEISLIWPAGNGRLAVRLKNVTAESDAYGWHVTAAQGAATLSGPSPAATLAALNQRLVQAEGGMPLASLAIDRLTLGLSAGGRLLDTDVRAAGQANMQVFAISFFAPGHAKAATGKTGGKAQAEKPLATLRLDSTSPHGVFQALRADVKDLTLGGRRGSREPDAAGTPVRASLDIVADWNRPEKGRQADTVTLTARDLDLQEWTDRMPGGPVRGTAGVTLACVRPAGGQTRTTLAVDSIGGGTISAETLEWLRGLPAGCRGFGGKLKGNVTFDRLSIRCGLAGDRGRFEVPFDALARQPLVSTRTLGRDVPLLWAAGGTFDAGDLWPPLAQGLGLGETATPATSPAK